jgi:hypothetical protein
VAGYAHAKQSKRLMREVRRSVDVEVVPVQVVQRVISKPLAAAQRI